MRLCLDRIREFGLMVYSLLGNEEALVCAMELIWVAFHDPIETSPRYYVPFGKLRLVSVAPWRYLIQNPLRWDHEFRSSYRNTVENHVGLASKLRNTTRSMKNHSSGFCRSWRVFPWLVQMYPRGVHVPNVAKWIQAFAPGNLTNNWRYTSFSARRICITLRTWPLRWGLHPHPSGRLDTLHAFPIAVENRMLGRRYEQVMEPE